MYGQFLRDILRSDFGQAQLCHNKATCTFTVSKNKKSLFTYVEKI